MKDCVVLSHHQVKPQQPDTTGDLLSAGEFPDLTAPLTVALAAGENKGSSHLVTEIEDPPERDLPRAT